MGASISSSKNLMPMSRRRLTVEEKTHLLLLCSTAGTPAIVDSAVRSGNVFDPKHMQRALELRAQSTWKPLVVGEEVYAI